MDILVKEEHLARAFELHRMNPVVDAHLDLAGEVLCGARLERRKW